MILLTAISLRERVKTFAEKNRVKRFALKSNKQKYVSKWKKESYDLNNFKSFGKKS